MKKLLTVILPACFFIISCNDQKSNETAVSAEATSSDQSKTYAYATARPVGWEWGSTDNLEISMNALKAYESGNIEECMKYFADTVRLEFDGFEKVVSRDSLSAMFNKQRSSYKNVTVRMEDYESVKSKSNGNEYVSLWYKEITEDSKGKIDSVECINDIGIKNGKIILLNEKTRHYMERKA